MDIIVLSLLLIGMIAIGVREQRTNEANIKKIPLRVNVNGIRGKSTATRLISAVLVEAGYNNLGKTTGTSPRMIYNPRTPEREIMRNPSGVSINEQLSVIDVAAKKGVDSLVCECMAVNPEYQQIYQKKMIQANVGVIVNVLEDHLEEMGPTLDQIAYAFTSTIPYNGKLIINQGPYTDYFKKIAKERKTQVFVADESEIPEGYMDEFDYVVFPNNIAIPLAFARALDIDKEVALRGMLNANPDPGALMVDEINIADKQSLFINAFAANDPDSTLTIWSSVKEMGYTQDYTRKPLVVFNGRGDRIDRTEQFVRDCIPFIEDDIDLIGMGSSLAPILDAYEKGNLSNVDQYYNMEDQDAKMLKDKIYKLMDGRAVFFIGNVHGVGEILLDEISPWYGDSKRRPQISLG